MTDTTQDLARQAVALSEMAADGQDIYEAAVTLGTQALVHKECQQYVLGRIGLEIKGKYGSATMNNWAKEIGVSEASARHYKRIVEVYGYEKCFAYAAKNIRYVFLRNAVFKLGNDAAAFMAKFVATPIGGTPPQLPKSNRPQVKKVLDITDAVICDVNAAGGTILIQAKNGAVNLLDYIGKEVHMIIKEVQS